MTSLKTQYHPQKLNPAKSINNVFIQPKLTINNPNDAYEQEADTVADKVIRMETPSLQAKAQSNNSFFKPAPISILPVQRKCAHCEEEEKKMQRKEMNGEEAAADEGLESYVGTLSSGGKLLPNEVRNFYEPRFGYNFSNVKVHTDTVAAKSAQSINALAYTSGNNIVFNNGQYAPNTNSGKRLLAHELTHVVQQGARTKNIQRQDTPSAPGTHGPAFEECTDETDITSDFWTFMNSIPGLLAQSAISAGQQQNINNVIQIITSPEGGIDLHNFIIVSCSHINSALAIGDEQVGAFMDQANHKMALSSGTWSNAADFTATQSLTSLLALLQTVAHEKRHATLGSSVQVDPATGLNPGYTAGDADQAAYRVEEILVKAEEIAVARSILGEGFHIPVDEQVMFQRYWNMVRFRVTPEEFTRLRNVIIQQLQLRYGFDNNCDNAITLGVIKSMETGHWHLCSGGRVAGTIPDGLNICSRPDGSHTICPV